MPITASAGQLRSPSSGECRRGRDPARRRTCLHLPEQEGSARPRPPAGRAGAQLACWRATGPPPRLHHRYPALHTARRSSPPAPFNGIFHLSLFVQVDGPHLESRRPAPAAALDAVRTGGQLIRGLPGSPVRCHSPWPSLHGDPDRRAGLADPPILPAVPIALRPAGPRPARWYDGTGREEAAPSR